MTEKNTVINVKTRKVISKKENKSKRGQGFIPAILYGKHLKEPVPIFVDKKDLVNKLNHSEAGLNTIFTLNIENETAKKGEEVALINDLQYESWSDDILHIDFHQVNTKEKIHTSVPVRTTGTASGIKFGGKLVNLMDKVEISCLPQNIPAYFSIDISALNIGDGILVEDIKVSEKIKILTPPKQMLLHIEGASEVKEEATSEDEAATATTEDKPSESK